MARNPDSALKLGQARGAALCAVVMHDLPVHEYAAREIKLALVGKGSADKVHVQHLVGIMLNLKGKLHAYPAHALPVPITHAHVRSSAQRLRVRPPYPWTRHFCRPGFGFRVSFFYFFCSSCFLLFFF